MKRQKTIQTAILIILFINFSVFAEQLRYGGSVAELQVYQVSDKTIGFKLSPLDANGMVEPLPASTMLVDFPRKVILAK
jgi:hypothetical protein